MEALTADEARQLFMYDQGNGLLCWAVNRTGSARAGSKAGGPSTCGYIKVKVNKRFFYAHRLAWLIYYGEWPDGQVDHINGVRTDNRICNLRLATASQNQWNARTRKDNKIGVKGVTYHYGKWMVRIRKHNKPMVVGYFESLDEAREAYQKASSELFGEFSNTGTSA